MQKMCCFVYARAVAIGHVCVRVAWVYNSIHGAGRPVVGTYPPRTYNAVHADLACTRGTVAGQMARINIRW